MFKVLASIGVFLKLLTENKWIPTIFAIIYVSTRLDVT